MVDVIDGVTRLGLLLAMLSGAALALIVPMILVSIVLARVTAGRPTPQDRRFVRTMLGVPGTAFGIGLALSIGGCAADDLHQDGTRERDLAHVAAASEPLIAAIDSFHDENGRYPHELEELVPRHLASVPGTGLARWGQYSYFDRPNGRFDLDVWTPTGWTDSRSHRRFLYAPDPSRDRELGATLRNGDWVFTPE